MTFFAVGGLVFQIGAGTSGETTGGDSLQEVWAVGVSLQANTHGLSLSTQGLCSLVPMYLYTPRAFRSHLSGFLSFREMKPAKLPSSEVDTPTSRVGLNNPPGTFVQLRRLPPGRSRATPTWGLVVDVRRLNTSLDSVHPEGRGRRRHNSPALRLQGAESAAT